MAWSLSRRRFLRSAAGLAAGGFVSGPAVFAQPAALAESKPEESPLEQALISPAWPEGLTISDTHVHLWDLRKLHLPWIAGAPKEINKTYDLAAFRKAAEGLPVARAVYMEVNVHPTQQAEEAAHVIALCERREKPLVGAVIGGSPDSLEFPEYVKRFAASKWVKGMRTVLHAGDRPRGYCLRPIFIDAMKRIGDAGWSFDLCMRPEELIDGVKLAEAVPQTTFVLDHCGNIGVLDSQSPKYAPWKEGLWAAAKLPNVVCKISGILDKTGSKNWTPTDLAPNINECLNAFGADRVLFGGDWPVCLIGGTYRSWAEALRTIVAERPVAFQRKLFQENAGRVYRLG